VLRIRRRISEKSIFSSRNLVSDECIEYKLNYYLIVEEVSGNDGELILENYGIKVSIESGGKEENIELRNITINELRIRSLLTMLSDNCVTPTSVLDVVFDWL